MKKALARDKWRSATEALKEANVLTREGLYKGAISRAFVAMENAARAALALKGLEPKTHAGLGEAFKNQLIRSGAMDKKWSEALGAASEARNVADYGAFYQASADDAQNQCAEADEFLKETGKYLTRQGLDDLGPVPEMPGTKPVRPGGDPKLKGPGQRGNGKPKGGSGPDHKRGQKR